MASNVSCAVAEMVTIRQKLPEKDSLAGRPVLVTGAMGCLGVWTMRKLLEADAQPVAFDRVASSPRFELILDERQRSRIPVVVGDIADSASVSRALDEHAIRNVVHLAALQIPFCTADPLLAARVNVLGTVNLFEAVRSRSQQIQHVVFASSAAIFDTRAQGHGPVPATHYGAYKQANESSARAYWHEHGLPSIALRPYVVYGVGRDQGMTSSLTKAMLAAALGVPYMIEHGGQFQLQYAPDVADAFVVACSYVPTQAHAFSLPGEPVGMQQVIDAISEAAPDSAGHITYRDTPMPFRPQLPEDGFSKFFGSPRTTPLTRGVSDTVDQFRTYITEKRIDPAAVLANSSAGTDSRAPYRLIA